MDSLNYAVNEGFKLSWKGALVGGTIGSAIGYNTAQEMVKKDPSNGLVAAIIFPLFPFLGVAGGTLGGFVCGAVKGGVSWAINGPFEPHSPDDTSVRLGVNVTCGVALLIFKCMHRNED